MNNTFYEMIFKRKSFHIFRNVGNESISKDELNDIQSAYSEFTPLNPGIKTAIRIVSEKQTNCKRGGEYCVLLYSEKKDGYLQNIGYLGEQLDLYLVSRNIGTLWFGIGKTKEEPFEDMEFVIMFSIRKISDDSKYRKDMCLFRPRAFLAALKRFRIFVSVKSGAHCPASFVHLRLSLPLR